MKTGFKKASKLLFSWKFVLILLMVFIIQYLLADNWSLLSIYLPYKYSDENKIIIASKEIIVPENVKIENIDIDNETGDVKIVYLRSKDCLIVTGRIKMLKFEYWEKMISDLYKNYDFESMSGENYYYGIRVPGDTLIAYHLTHPWEDAQYMSENILLIPEEIFFKFYGPEITTEAAMDYIREMYYYDIKEEFFWEYEIFADPEDLRL